MLTLHRTGTTTYCGSVTKGDKNTHTHKRARGAENGSCTAGPSGKKQNDYHRAIDEVCAETEVHSVTVNSSRRPSDEIGQKPKKYYTKKKCLVIVIATE